MGKLLVRVKKAYRNRINQRRYGKGKDFICICCGKAISRDESYSNKGKNATCCDCVTKGAEAEGMMFNSEYCRKYIWVD